MPLRIAGVQENCPLGGAKGVVTHVGTIIIKGKHYSPDWRQCVHESLWEWSLWIETIVASFDHGVQTIVYIILALYNKNSYLSIMDLLANPILSDYFGFSVDTQVFFFLGVSSLMPLTVLFLWVSQFSLYLTELEVWLAVSCFSLVLYPTLLMCMPIYLFAKEMQLFPNAWNVWLSHHGKECWFQYTLQLPGWLMLWYWYAGSTWSL